jgi:hypothetical protein
MADEILKQPSRFVDILREQRDFISANYQTCTQEIENEGHRFGEDLSASRQEGADRLPRHALRPTGESAHETAQDFTLRTGAPRSLRSSPVPSWRSPCSKPEPPKIGFAPYDKSHQSKMDLAQVDYKYPIAPAELARVTPEYLAKLDQEQLDQLYARLTAGPIPDGAFDGRILLPRGESGKFRLSEIVGGFTGTRAASQGAGGRGCRRNTLARQGLLP